MNIKKNSNEKLVTSVKLLRVRKRFEQTFVNPYYKLHKIILICRNVSKKGDYKRLFLGWINKFRMAVVTQPTRFDAT